MPARPKDFMACRRWHHLRVGADALSTAQYRLHLVAGRLRHGLPVLRHWPGGLDRNLSTRKSSSRCVPAPQHCAMTSVTASRMWFSWAWGAAGQLRSGGGCGAPHHRAAAAGIRNFGPLGDGVDGRSGSCHPQACRRTARVTLALSLHAPDDELRDTLVPVNDRWKITEALEAARYYADVTGRRVSIEYALIRDVNDQPWRADLLGKRLHRALGPLVHVNLIPLNPLRVAIGTPAPRRWSGSSSDESGRRGFPARCATRGAARSEPPADSWPPRAGSWSAGVSAEACGQLASEGRAGSWSAGESSVMNRDGGWNVFRA